MTEIIIKATTLILSVAIAGGLQYLIDKAYIKRVKRLSIDLSKSILEYFRKNACNQLLGILFLSYFFCRITGDTSDKPIYYITIAGFAILFHGMITLLQLRRVLKCSKFKQ